MNPEYESVREAEARWNEFLDEEIRKEQEGIEVFLQILNYPEGEQD